MDIELEGVAPLRFADGAPVRAASAVVRLGDGWLVAQDDATHAAWLQGDVRGAGWPPAVARVRALPPVAGLDTFEEAAGTKHLKPDLEAAFEVPGDRAPRSDVGVVDASVLLGSGSSPARMRSCFLTLHDGEPVPTVVGLGALYAAVARALDVAPDLLNLEGACVVDDVVRWFHRGLPSAGVPTASVDVDLAALLEAVSGRLPPGQVPVRDARRYDLGTERGVGLAVTDVVRLRDGRLVVSAAAEDTPDPRDDGPVVASALAVLDGDVVTHMTALPHIEGSVPKVEGLAVAEEGTSADGRTEVRLLATVDADDPAAASLAVRLRAVW